MVQIVFLIIFLHQLHMTRQQYERFTSCSHDILNSGGHALISLAFKASTVRLNVEDVAVVSPSESDKQRQRQHCGHPVLHDRFHMFTTLYPSLREHD